MMGALPGGIFFTPPDSLREGEARGTRRVRDPPESDKLPLGGSFFSKLFPREVDPDFLKIPVMRSLRLRASSRLVSEPRSKWLVSESRSTLWEDRVSCFSLPNNPFFLRSLAITSLCVEPPDNRLVIKKKKKNEIFVKTNFQMYIFATKYAYIWKNLWMLWKTCHCYIIIPNRKYIILHLLLSEF